MTQITYTRLLACGSRTWNDIATIRQALLEHPARILIHGSAPGADALAARAARELGWASAAVPAEWARDGNAAGPIRNAAMLLLQPEVVLAFHIGNSPGTRNMITQAETAGIPVVRYTPSKP